MNPVALSDKLNRARVGSLNPLPLFHWRVDVDFLSPHSTLSFSLAILFDESCCTLLSVKLGTLQLELLRAELMAALTFVFSVHW